MKNSYNVLSELNFAEIKSKSSEVRGCAAVNVLCDNEKRLWLSEQGLPQEIIFDLTHVKSRPDHCCTFGWYCWHSYKSNPSLVELWVSEDESHWLKWGSFEGKPTNGENLFKINPLPLQYTFLKLLICDTFGSSNTYINQVYLFEDLGDSISKSLDDSKEDKSFDVPHLKSFDDPKSLNLFNFTSNVPDIPQNFSINSTPFISKIENPTYLYSDQADLHSIKSPAYTLNLPKVDEVGKLRKEIFNWSQDISAMQQSLEMISEKVEKLTQTCPLDGSKNVAKEIRDEMQKALNSEPGTWRSEAQGKIEEVFNREIAMWENQVMKPDFKRILQMAGGSCRSAEEILKEIDDRLRKKAYLIRKKELMLKLAAYKPKWEF